jgi:hypothetical protein
MINFNPLAIAVAVVAAFVLSPVYYAALGNQLHRLARPMPRPPDRQHGRYSSSSFGA